MAVLSLAVTQKLNEAVIQLCEQLGIPYSPQGMSGLTAEEQRPYMIAGAIGMVVDFALAEQNQLIRRLEDDSRDHHALEQMQREEIELLKKEAGPCQTS